MGKDSAIPKSVAGRAVIEGIICPNAGVGKKAEAGGKTYGRVQGDIKKHFRGCDRQSLIKWQEQTEEVSYLQEQKSYVQGYVDCIYLLSGLGLLKKDEFVDKFIEEVKK